MRPARLGAVSYLNTKPLVEGLTGFAPQIELSFALPSRLAEQLAEGIAGRLVRAQVTKGKKVKDVQTYKLRIDNASPLLLNGVALAGPELSPEVNPSMVAGFSLPLLVDRFEWPSAFVLSGSLALVSLALLGTTRDEQRAPRVRPTDRDGRRVAGYVDGHRQASVSASSRSRDSRPCSRPSTVPAGPRAQLPKQNTSSTSTSAPSSAARPRVSA